MADEPRPKFHVGQKVQLKHLREQIGIIVREPEFIAGEYWYEIFFSRQSAPRHPESSLELYEGETSDIKSLLKNNSFSTSRTMSRMVTITKLETPLRNNIYALYSSRTHFLSYQYKPVLKFLDSVDSTRARMLIADEVGLGKTIEAGLVYIEEKARYPIDRVLIVCPKALCTKWRVEMFNKFGEEFKTFEPNDIRTFLRDVQERGETLKLKAIVSLQSLRGKQFLEEWEAISPHIDLVIIDEAHHMRNAGTLSHRLGRILSETADTMLLLTATPVHMGNKDLFNLLRILDETQFNNAELFFESLKANSYILETLRFLREKFPPDFSKCENTLRQVESTSESERFLSNPIYKDILYRLRNPSLNSRDFTVEIQRDINSLNVLSNIVTRSRKRDVLENRIIRRAVVCKVDNFTQEEYNFYNAVREYVISHYKAKGLGQFGAFISIMPLRQVASCIPAMRERYIKQLPVSLGEDFDLSEYLDDRIIEDNSYSLEEVERTAILQLIEATKAVEGIDSKFDTFVEALKGIEPTEKVMIFSYFKLTLEYLNRRLNHLGYSTKVISGDYKDEVRQETMRRFREDPSLRILLSSEVGSEGLDFEFCHIMINYDLPWNPMKVEQRIGRLDRIGQNSETITIINLTIPQTIEDRILERLYMRIGIFEESIGDLEAILGDEIKRLSIDLMSRDLTPREQEQRIEQTAEVICRRKKDWAEMENKSSKFIGHDQFFLDEMDRIRANKRYISSNELLMLITDFLKTNYPKCSLQQAEGPDIWHLKINDDIIGYIREKVDKRDPHMSDFISAYYSAGPKGIKITFNSEEAMKERNLHFVNIYHPLVNTIRLHYLENPGELHPVAKIQVQTDAVLEGEYLYFIHLINIDCARARNLLEAIFVPCNNSQAEVPPETSEFLLSDMVTTGTTYEEFKAFDKEKVIMLIDEADRILEKRIRQRREEVERINESLVSNKIASLDRSFQVKISKQKELLEKGIEGAADPRIIRMREGSIRNLNSEYQRRRSQLENQRQVNISFTPKGAGIVKVINVNA